MENDNSNDWNTLFRGARHEEIGGASLARATLDDSDSDECGTDPSDMDSDATQYARTTNDGQQTTGDGEDGRRACHCGPTAATHALLRVFTITTGR